MLGTKSDDKKKRRFKLLGYMIWGIWMRDVSTSNFRWHAQVLPWCWGSSNQITSCKRKPWKEMNPSSRFLQKHLWELDLGYQNLQKKNKGKKWGEDCTFLAHGLKKSFWHLGTKRKRKKEKMSHTSRHNYKHT